MPPGDRSRTWFPELVTDLRAAWHADLPWEAVIELRRQLQTRLDGILKARGITPARIRCFHCGHVGPGAPPVLTVRAVLLALRRFDIESEATVRTLDKAWKKHRALLQLDGRGEQSSGTAAERAAAHTHVH